MRGSILAIGDIHGCDVALATLLDGIGVTTEDTVVVLGDLIDRGPNSRGVIDRLIQLSRTVKLIGICGNHDEMLLHSLEQGSPRLLWIGAGAIATLNSYGGDLSAIPHEHIEFLKSLRDYWQTETHIFVHANVEPDIPMEQQRIAFMRWSKLQGDEIRHCSGKTVICGHTSLASGVPALCDGFICIDTKAYGGLWLTCLDVENELVWQSSEAGELRGPFPLREIATPFQLSEG
ncbi:MAG: metallophosphoesterase [Planctomycetaceae bacterium]